MSTFVKLRQITKSPDRYIAFEYESNIYCSYSRTKVFPNVRWQSDELGESAIIEVLCNRGWHTTDIGDEFDEAHKQFQGAV